ncbi:hypothetical protein GUJ93_ZPchr0010g7278 [Zizania palustris]|uniref:Uncharacterized protein n=1 Tax=Zizania palustris TaxID=103762 RepID=A0A8J5WE48_ZIZPA|nr:hypothetical protein GUJ93_ZPchr0010g7278 [Zizania palustris]
MPENVKLRIQQMGFGDLLKLRMGNISDRYLGRFLLDCVKEDPLRLQISRKVLPITPQAVATVFGIPSEGVSFPKFSKQEMDKGKTELRKKCDELGMEGLFADKNKYQKLGTNGVPRWVLKHYVHQQSPQIPEIDEWAVKCFMMCVCNALLFCTSNEKITGYDYLVCKDLSSLGGYNWAKDVVDDIQSNITWWKKRRDATTPTLPGSIAFLVLNNVRTFYQNVRTLGDKEQLVGEEDEPPILCVVRGGRRKTAGAGTSTTDLISLDPELAETIASITDESIKAYVSDLVKNYEVAVTDARIIISKEENKIKQSQRKIEESQTQISNAEKMLRSKVNSATTQITDLDETIGSYIARTRSSKQPISRGENLSMDDDDDDDADEDDAHTCQGASAKVNDEDSEEESQLDSTEKSGRASEDDLSENPSCHEDAEEEPHSSGPKQLM